MVEFKSVFNSDVTRELNKAQMKRIWWVYLFISAIFILGGILELEEEIFLAVFMLTFGVFFTPLCIFLTKFAQKKLDKSMHVMSEETVENYVFDFDTAKIIQQKGTHYNSVTTTDYTYFYKVVENKDNFFFYISKAQCHVVKKSGLVSGDFEELRDILRKNILPKNLKLLK